MRTPQQALKDALPAIQAAAEGKEIEYLYGGGNDWRLAPNPMGSIFAHPEYKWRVKPEPKRTLRPWKESEVPVGATIRFKANYSSVRMLIVCSREHGLTGGGSHWPFPALADICEHSLDGGRTWLPCGVWEEVA